MLADAQDDTDAVSRAEAESIDAVALTEGVPLRDPLAENDADTDGVEQDDNRGVDVPRSVEDIHEDGDVERLTRTVTVPVTQVVALTETLLVCCVALGEDDLRGEAEVE